MTRARPEKMYHAMMAAPIVNAAFSDDGGTVVTADSGALRTWDVSLALRPPFLDWSKIADKSPYVLEDGVLIQRSDARGVDAGKPRRSRPPSS